MYNWLTPELVEMNLAIHGVRWECETPGVKILRYLLTSLYTGHSTIDYIDKAKMLSHGVDCPCKNCRDIDKYPEGVDDPRYYPSTVGW